LLLAHAKAVQLYRLKYQEHQGGRISMAVSSHWGLPKDRNSSTGRSAASYDRPGQWGWGGLVLVAGAQLHLCMHQNAISWLQHIRTMTVNTLQTGAQGSKRQLQTADGSCSTAW
jgi:nickel-dependent lactate racemase